MLRKIVEKFRQKAASYAAEKVEIFPYGNLDNSVAFSAGVLANYSEYESLYFTSVDVSTAIDLIAHYAMTEISFTGSDSAVKQAEQFAREVNLRSRLINDMRMMLIYGNAYEYIAEDGSNLVLQSLNPKKVAIKVDKYGEIQAYTYQPGNSVDLPPERVLHFAYGRIGNSPYGYSLVHQVYDLIKLKQAIERVAAVLAYRMSHPLLHGKASPGKVEKLRQVLENRIRENSSSVEKLQILNQIVTDKDAEITVLSSQLDVSGVVRVLEYLQNQVDKALKVPRIFYGEPEGSNRASSYNQIRIFRLFLDSLRSVVKEELESKLFPALGVDVEIEFEEITTEEEMIWADIAAKLYQVGVLNLNEAREYLGLPPLEPEE